MPTQMGASVVPKPCFNPNQKVGNVLPPPVSDILGTMAMGTQAWVTIDDIIQVHGLLVNLDCTRIMNHIYVFEYLNMLTRFTSALTTIRQTGVRAHQHFASIPSNKRGVFSLGRQQYSSMRIMASEGQIQSELMESMRNKIQVALEAEDVQVTDMQGDGRHVEIVVVSSQFEGKSSVNRQRMVYKVRSVRQRLLPHYSLWVFILYVG